jgi:cytochrome P450
MVAMFRSEDNAMDVPLNSADAPVDVAAPRRIADLPGPRGLPWLGNALQLDPRRFHATLERWAEQFGPLYKFTVLGVPFVVSSQHDAVVRLMRERPDLLRRNAATSRVLEESGTRGLFSAEGDDWRRQRKLVMRALTPEVVQRFFPTMAGMTERLRARWAAAVAAGRPVDLLRDLKAYTLDVTVALAMGVDVDTLGHEDNPLQRDIDFVFKTTARRVVTPLPYWRYLKLPADRAADAAFARIVVAIGGFIARARARLDADPALRARPSNLLEALVVARDDAGSEFTDADVIGNAITMVFAGEDTTSNSVAWLLDLLARDAPAQALLARECDAVLGAQAVLTDGQALDRFPYLDAANREAMRLKPVAPFLSLDTLQPIEIDGVQLPAHTAVLTLLRSSARRHAGLADADAFKPARWLDATGDVNDTGRTLFPFGGGARLCPGRYLALAEIKIVMSMIAKNFSVAPLPGSAPAEERFTFTMTPATLPLALTLRESLGD